MKMLVGKVLSEDDRRLHPDVVESLRKLAEIDVDIKGYPEHKGQMTCLLGKIAERVAVGRLTRVPEKVALELDKESGEVIPCFYFSGKRDAMTEAYVGGDVTWDAGFHRRRVEWGWPTATFYHEDGSVKSIIKS